jgi:MFS family permease
VLPALIGDWQLSSREAGLLGGALFGGTAAAVPVLVSLTDRIRPKRIYLVCTTVSAVGSALVAIIADGFWSAFALRVLTGVGLAGTYMPGLKALSDHFDEPVRSRAATIYTSVFALGTALSIWIGGTVGDWHGWRWSFAAAAVGNVVALAVGWVFLPEGRADSAGSRRRLLDIRPVLKNRQVVRLIFAYTGHLWEMFGFRIWGVAFLVAAEKAGNIAFPITPVTLASIAALIGVPASMATGEAALRFGRRTVLLTAMALSATTALVVGSSFSLPFAAIASLVLFYGIVTYGDSGTLSGGIVAVADPAVRGSTLAVYSSAGFIGGLLGPAAVGVAIDAAGGTGSAGAWLVAFAVMGAGSVCAAVAVLTGAVENRR